MNPLNDSSDAASELNNLLQIISGTSSMLENICEGTEGSHKYMTMLRESIERAEKVTAQLVEQAGGADKNLRPGLAAFAKAKEPAPPREPASKKSILVVDDEPMIVALSKQTLVDAGFNVVTAQSGFECLDLFRRRPRDFELILLDLRMPFMDGEEIFERMRMIRPDAPVVMCTGFIEKERLDRMLSAGLLGVLHKPFRPKELASYIHAILDNIRLAGGGSAADHCDTAAVLISERHH
jgi:CheY-like chemotaxis protein